MLVLARLDLMACQRPAPRSRLPLLVLLIISPRSPKAFDLKAIYRVVAYWLANSFEVEEDLLRFVA